MYLSSFAYYENKDPGSLFSYYANEDPNLKNPKSIEITSLDVHWAPAKVIIDFNTFVHFARGVFLLIFYNCFRFSALFSYARKHHARSVQMY